MRNTTYESNRRIANKLWGKLPVELLGRLQDLTLRHEFSITSGDVTLLDGHWYVTHVGLLRLATRKQCVGIHASPCRDFCNANGNRWVFRAIVYKTSKSKGFVGYGDADPSNVSALVHGAEMRVAETRAVNRALRKAYGIGICSVEEIGSFADRPQPSAEPKRLPPQPANGNYGGPKVRARLCQVIRQHNLDPTLVKAYASDFCGVKALRDATREQVENFVAHLADWAQTDKDALHCQLNSYLGAKEGVA